MTFDELWSTAIADARSKLTAAGSPAAPLADRFARPSFPGALVLLSAPRSAGQPSGAGFRSEAAQAVAGDPRARATGLDAATAEGVLTSLFVNRADPSSTGVSEPDLQLVVQKALEREGVLVSEAEAREVVQLLSTGQFFHDLIGTAGAIFSTIPALPGALLEDIGGIPRLPGLVGVGVLRDFFELLTAIPRVAADLRDGKIDEPPAVMTHLLALLYGLGSIERVRDLLARILAPENRSVRLAVLLYARSNGFALTDDHLDLVHDRLLASDAPDLGPVLAASLEFLESRYGGDELEAVVGALQRGG